MERANYLLLEKFGVGSIISTMIAKNKQYSEAKFSYCASVIKGSELYMVTLLYSTSAVQWSLYAVACHALFWERDIMKCTMRLHKVACTLISRAGKQQGHEVEALASQLCRTIVPCSLVVAPGGCDRS